MKLYILFLPLLLLSATFSYGQRVSFGKDYLAANDLLHVKIAAPIDTLKERTGNIYFLFFANNGYVRDTKDFTKRDTVEGWLDPALTDDIPLQVGIQSCFIEFSDTLARGYNILVSNSLNNPASNIAERILFPMTSGDYQDFYDLISKKIERADSATLISSIPAGMKAVLCIDFEGPKGFSGNDKEVWCMASRYLFKSPDHTDEAGTDVFFRAFTGNNRLSPIYTLLSGTWQMTKDNFDQGRLPTEDEVFGGKKNYKFIRHPNAEVNKRIVIGYFESRYFRRILIYVNG